VRTPCVSVVLVSCETGLESVTVRTLKNVLDIDCGVRLGEQFPRSFDAWRRVYQRSVHVEEAGGVAVSKTFNPLSDIVGHPHRIEVEGCGRHGISG
jgi:hypothetical protein